MTDSELPYDSWLEDALRGVIRRALLHTAEHGLPGAHHFYLTFATGADGVELSPELRAKYPDEMTIVLQHQFWDMTMENDRFAVTLKFRGRPSRIVIPLGAVSAFGDPSVNFGLQLKTLSAELPGEDSAEAQGDGPAGGADQHRAVEPAGQVIALDSFRKK
ncbi:MAG TPA: ClpXP protease specificity-enhancing factor SspB [Rhodospirillales bacterium]|nr:ClpXP protease specificity-enhancing factor SspB [Rhodospirillales bacterium]